MANASNGKVVSLGDHPRARARLSARESADVLSGCRNLALERMVKALSGMLDRVEDDLFELAGKASDREVQNTYLDARAQARVKRSAIEATFRKHFAEFFDRKVQGNALHAPHVGTEFEELKLVETADLEETLAVREMSRKLGAACETELFALGQRMGFLLERPELDDEANPLSPSTVCSALKDACDQLQAGFKVRLALLHQLERYACEELQAIYHDLNVHLVQREILPEIRHAVRRAPASPPRAPQASEGVKPDPSQNVFDALAQWLGKSLGVPAGAGLPGVRVGNPGTSVPADFVAELTRMHRDAGLDTHASPDALVNVVKSVKASPQASALGTVDAMTIDLVSMLFDYIFEDRLVPTRVKAALGRLQIPTLKVALLDKDFFSSHSHPARRLIDRLADCAIGLDESNANSAEALALVDDVVHEVVARFDTDLALFEGQLTRVEAFMEERGRAEYAVVERSARLVEERERVEMARGLAAEQVRARLDATPWAPPIVREMLQETWVRALADVRMAEGESCANALALMSTMDDLLWSVEPKATAEDRKRLLALLPGMLRALTEGMRRGGLDPAACETFLGTLVDCHAAAMKAGARGMAAIPAAPKAQPAHSRPSIARELLPVGDIRVEEIRLRAGDGSLAARNVFTRTGIWTNLQRGTWVELKGTGGMARARLTWISPNKGVYLFTNPLACDAAMSISPEALAEQMRLGEARILSGAPLVERAVDSMLAQLRREGDAPVQG